MRHMPKGHREPRTFTCRACGTEFTSTKVGKATWYCQTEACDEARGVSKAKRRARLAPAERRRLESEERRAAAHAKRMATIEAKMRERGLEIFAPMFDSPDQMVMVEDILEIAERATRVEPTNQELRKALTALSRAQGPHGRHEAAQRLSALFLRLSDRWRPRAAERPISAVSEIEAPAPA
jgi:hypothetical protein